MSATFAAPIAAMLLAVELLLFELKPRSLIPVALASIAGAAMRRHLLGAGPLFPIPDIDVAAVVQPGALAWCVVVGALAGRPVRAADRRGLRRRGRCSGGCACTGCGGRRWAASSSASAGSSARRRSASATTRSRRMLGGGARLGPTLRLMVVKAGDLGGVARLGNVGRRAGAAADDGQRAGRRSRRAFLPAYGAGFWPLVSMAAILAGTMRAPLTALVFAIELTGRFGAGAADADGRDRRAHVHGAGPQAVDPDGEGRAPRLTT